MAANDSKRHPTRPRSPGAAIRARRIWLGLQQIDLVERTGGVINLKLLSKLENDHTSPSSLRIGKYRALLDALEWTPQDFGAETGTQPVEPVLPGADDFEPSLRVPLVGSLTGGLPRMNEQPMDASSETIGVDAAHPRLQRPDRLVAMTVTDGAMLSEAAQQRVPAGATVVIEANATPRAGDLVAAWLAERELAVIAEHQERQSAILRSVDAAGPLFRIADAGPLDVRGVVRLIQQYV